MNGNLPGVGVIVYHFVKTVIAKRWNSMVLDKSRIFAVLLMVIVAGSVRAEDAKEVVIASAKELKGTKAKKITWKKDEAKMVLVKPYVPTQYEGQLLTAWVILSLRRLKWTQALVFGWMQLKLPLGSLRSS